jgi:hypothetical protein
MSTEPEPPEEAPGVPGFRTWKGVYLFVFGCFLLMVIALTLFTRVFA